MISLYRYIGNIGRKLELVGAGELRILPLKRKRAQSMRSAL